MIVYTYSEARQKLARLLEQSIEEGEVRIRRKDGKIFVVKPETKLGSPLDVPGINLGIDVVEIIEAINEGRRYRKEIGVDEVR